MPLGWQRVMHMIRGTCTAALAVLLSSFATAAPQERPDAGPMLAMPVPETFPDLSYLFAYIAHSRGLGSSSDSELSREIAASSAVEQLHDYSADPILVVKADLLDHIGNSRLRSPNGNYPFYVLRAESSHLVLLGMMFGTTYSVHLEGRQLHFEMRLNTGRQTTRAMSFLVDENVLVNLSAPSPGPLLSDGSVNRL
jgi:hypothetical protein